MKAVEKILFFVVLIIVVACNSPRTSNISSNQKDTVITQEDEPEEIGYEFDFAFVSANTYIILDTVLDNNWAEGDAYSPIFYADGRFNATKNVDLDKIPDKYKKIIGQTVKLGTNTGQIFEVKISSLKIISESIPHFGVVEAWKDRAVTEAEKAEEIWNMGELFLVAEFVVDEEELPNVIFAVPSDNNLVCLNIEKHNSSSTVMKTTEIIEKLSETEIFKKYQVEYQNYSAGNWWENQDGWISAFSFSFNDNDYIAMTLSLGNSCGSDYFFTTFSISKFNQNDSCENEFLSDENYTFILALDIEGDGELEYILDDFFGKYILIKKVNNEWIIKKEWTIPYLDCPC